MITPILATVDQLLDHLRLPARTGSPPADMPDLQLKLDAATELVCNYIADRHPADPDWISEIEGWSIDESMPSSPFMPGSPSTVPPRVVVLAVLEQAAEFYRFRGDDESSSQPDGERGYLSKSVENLLSKYKNRAFA